MIRLKSFRLPRFIDGLGFRLAILLSVALLPLGVISVAQTLRVLADARLTSDTALIGLTADAVAGQRALMEGALGSARALAPLLSETFDRPAECSALAAEFVRNSGLFAFAGFMTPDGSACLSEDGPTSFADTPVLERRLENPRTMVEVVEAGAVTGLPVLTITEPLWRQGILRGFVVLSVPFGAVEIVGRRTGPQGRRPAAIQLVDSRGALFMPLAMQDAAAAQLPADVVLTDYLGVQGQPILRGATRGGTRATFVFAPVIPGQVYAIGVWPQDMLGGAWERGSVLALLFPFLMWFVSLSVAFFAVHRLVIRYVTHVNGEMRRFAIGQREGFTPLPGRPPVEFRQLYSTFNKLRRIVTRDEARISAALNEKTVLLKEVHHRVKNNLQLIASILSMQMRKVDEPELRRVLKSVQDRVMSLATIHRILYQSERVADVRADRLLQEILHQPGSFAADGAQIRLAADVDPIRLYPDQVVPLALLATEAVTNAYKFMGRPGQDDPWIRIRFKSEAGARVRLEISNSTGTPIADTAYKTDGTSLGGHLITAFARQLNAEFEEGHVLTSAGPGYRLSLSFEAQGFVPPDAPEDWDAPEPTRNH
ncbi:sensor histidine kinase [Halodurantibacterium flavum]|uniref:histidine kinase n=1 Tax=Halodurantibacterium flavum TaxID=1382802 RepID=A0ABW4S1N1_9RHOB